MKKLTTAAALLTALLFSGALLTANAQGMWSDEDLAAFESDNWLEDDYGLYDEDFAWESDDELFTDWTDDADDDWLGYDDSGEYDWFDY